ncbi:hypothetical protein EYF80_003668 [Liparis tanakae]|uniref:Uncharacterized protein n=1 Tax=Liparis tanakae TaxID=230148 RepID=A0A4Z2J8L5_9TELE|nr:hypothetical protein EYF80_003668 [Liparis tanakae]
MLENGGGPVEGGHAAATFSPSLALWIADSTLSPRSTCREIRNNVCTYPCSTVWQTYRPASERLTHSSMSVSERSAAVGMIPPGIK